MAELLAPYAELEQKLLDNILIYINILLRWNARINLTAIRDPRQIVQRHFGESFFAARVLLRPKDVCKIVDLGSGAGFPGLPFAMYAPQSEITLIESQKKKAAFLNEAVRVLGLKNVNVFSDRAESYAGTAELVVMRAVEKFETVLPLASRLVQPGGRLALMIGAARVQTATGLLPQFAWQDPINVPDGHSRVLLVGTNPVKVG